VTCGECYVRIASMPDEALRELTTNPNHDAYTWLREHLQECKSPECQRICGGLLALQPCAQLASMALEKIERSPDFKDENGWIREHFRRCKIAECRRIFDRLLDLQLGRTPPERRRAIEKAAAVLAFRLGWQGSSSRVN